MIVEAPSTEEVAAKLNALPPAADDRAAEALFGLRSPLTNILCGRLSQCSIFLLGHKYVSTRTGSRNDNVGGCARRVV